MSAFSILLSLNVSSNLAGMSKPLQYRRCDVPTTKMECNLQFVLISCIVVFSVTWITWLIIFLSGDVHPNPGPIDNISLDHSFNSVFSATSSSSSLSVVSHQRTCPTSRHLYTVMYRASTRNWIYYVLN